MDVHSRSEESRGAGPSTITDTLAGQGGSTYTEVIQEESSADAATHSLTSANTLRLRLTKKPSKNDRRVSWTNDTVDNEFLNKKKSKCCCVYTRPRTFDESSEEDENADECAHCKGHRKTDFNSKRESRDRAAGGGAGGELSDEDMSHDGMGHHPSTSSSAHRHSVDGCTSGHNHHSHEQHHQH
jgi:protein phosphatase 1 regulatory subunit 11